MQSAVKHWNAPNLYRCNPFFRFRESAVWKFTTDRWAQRLKLLWIKPINFIVRCNRVKYTFRPLLYHVFMLLTAHFPFNYRQLGFGCFIVRLKQIIFNLLNFWFITISVVKLLLFFVLKRKQRLFIEY